MTAVDAPPKDRLVDAAREVLEADGLEGLTLRAIARHAGVSHGAPLRHFTGLSHLLSRVAAEGFEELILSVDGALAEVGRAAGPRERVAAAGSGYVRFALAHPGVFGLMFRGERVDVTDAVYADAGSRAFGQLVDLVAAAHRDGWGPDDASIEELSVVVWATVHGLAQLWLHGGIQGVLGADADVERIGALTQNLLFGPIGRQT